MDAKTAEQIKEKLSDLNRAIHNNREKQAAAESLIKSLGPDARDRLAAEKTAMENELEHGRGSFPLYDKLLDRIADAETRAIERDKAYKSWLAFRSTISDLEAQLALIKPIIQDAYLNSNRTGQ